MRSPTALFREACERNRLRFLRMPVLLGLATVAVVAMAAPASASTSAHRTAPLAAPALAVTPSLNATIRLSNCSASLVRFPTSVDTDRAMMLTNGHCYEGGFIPAGQVLVNRSSTRSGTLLNSAGTGVATVRADLLLYATMTGTDVSLYRLNQTIATIRTNTGISPLTISASHPASGISIFIPSGYHAQIWNCSINGFAATVREDQWTWHDSIRYSMPCQIIPGTSGSPVVSVATGEVVGANNTINENGEMCTLDNPCEVNPDGSTTATLNQGYAQETYWFNTCLTASRTIDLTIPGCLLTGATGGGTTIYSDNFETSTGWTANPSGTDTATTGQWVRGDPAGTSSGGVTLQLGTTVSGTNDLVTGAAAGATAGDFDVDGGTTSIQSPAITLPSTGTLTLRFSWYLAHLSNASSADFFRVRIVGPSSTTTVFSQAGSATNRAGAWAVATASLASFAGQTIRIRIEAADASTGSLIEAGVDDVSITQA
jgi:Trypsin-like peptidase domain